MSAIKEISGRVMQDSRGEDTIEVAVHFESGMTGVASVPSGKSRGKHEAAVVDPESAVRFINDKLNHELRHKSFVDLKSFDDYLISLDGTENKSNFGGNTLLGLSVAFARGLSLERNIPLYVFIGESLGKNFHRGKLRLFANIINGGLHAKSNLRFQEHIAIPVAGSFEKQTEKIKMLYDGVGKEIENIFKMTSVKIGDEGGYALKWHNESEPFEVMERVRDNLKITGVNLGIDAAAGSIQDAVELELSNIYEEWARRFGLIYIEDPFYEENFASFAELRRKLPNVIITGDDLTTTNVELLRRANAAGSINGVIIKPNQIGTLTEALDAVRTAREYGWQVVVSHRSGETMDDWIADFAFGSGADGLKLGAPSRPERIAKYNRLLRIEKEIDRISNND